MNPVALIIGAGPGIGQAVGAAFAREGCDVALAARTPSKLETIRQEISKFGTRVRSYAVDAGEDAALRAMVEQVRTDLGDPAVLVYNVASQGMTKPVALTGDKLVHDFKLNVGGALAAVQAVVEPMKAARKGTILLTGGGFAYEPSANYASLSLGKAALRNLTYSLAQELGGYGIHVATVSVYGFIQSGTHFDPNRIAEVFLKLHRQRPGHFQIEQIYK